MRVGVNMSSESGASCVNGATSSVEVPDSREAMRQAGPRREEAMPLGLGARIANLVGVVGPLLGLLAGIILLWGWGFDWVDLGLLGGMYLVTSLGITVGFH